MGTMAMCVKVHASDLWTLTGQYCGEQCGKDETGAQVKNVRAALWVSSQRSSGEEPHGCPPRGPQVRNPMGVLPEVLRGPQVRNPMVSSQRSSGEEGPGGPLGVLPEVLR
ncbi:unnamed protein product [Boreogadus saida]